MKRKRFNRYAVKWFRNSEKLFEGNMERLEAFAEQYGRLPHKHEAPRLFSWMNELRSSRHEGKVASDCIQKLDAFGFVWESQVANWETCLTAAWNEVKTGKKQKEDCNENYLWVKRQADALRSNRLDTHSRERLARLSTLEPSVLFNNKWLSLWTNVLNELRALMGQVLLPAVEDDLTETVADTNLSSNTNTNDAVVSCTPDTPVAGPRTSPQAKASFGKNFEELQKFLAMHQRFPSKEEDGKLYGWMAAQRLLRRKNEISMEAEERLNAIGFVWSLNDLNWHTNYAFAQQLCAGTLEKGKQFTTTMGWVQREVERLKERDVNLYRKEKMEQLIDGALPVKELKCIAEKNKKLFANYLAALAKAEKEMQASREVPGEPYLSDAALEYFNDKFAQLQQHLAEHNAFPTVKHRELYFWLLQMRARKNKGTLHGQFVQRLTAIGFWWRFGKERWAEAKTLLQTGAEDQAHCSRVTAWLEKKARGLNSGRLTPDETQKLLELLHPNGTDECESSGWQVNLAALAMMREPGFERHLHLPTKDETANRLARWELRMRLLKAAGLMPSKCLLQFQNVVRNDGAHNAAWQKRYEQVRKHIKDHNAVPTFYWNGLYSPEHASMRRWVDEQRKGEQLTAMQKALWDELNVETYLRTETWDLVFEALQQYVEQHSELPTSGKLGEWLRNQGARYRLGTLPDERIKMLRSVNVCFERKQRPQREQANEQKWLARFIDLIAFRKKNPGKWPVVTNSLEERRLAQWCYIQRQAYRGLMSNGVGLKNRSSPISWSQ